MVYFSNDFKDFLSELSKNNKKEWFDANRKRYESSVKKPFADFVQGMIDRIHADDPEVDIAPKDAIFRINRDIRFSPDKTPYKTEMSALISRGGKKDKGFPGFFFQLRPTEIRVYGGVHMVDKDVLYRIRQRIAENLKLFADLINGKNFKTKYSDILGEKHKRIPTEFQEAAAVQPLIYNKSFYYFAKLNVKLLTDEKLADIFMEYYFAGKPVARFFQQAFEGK